MQPTENMHTIYKHNHRWTVVPDDVIVQIVSYHGHVCGWRAQFWKRTLVGSRGTGTWQWWTGRAWRPYTFLWRWAR